MSEQHPNLILIQSFFTAYAANDAKAMRQILAQDIQWIIPGRNPTSRVKTGIDEVLAYFKQLQAFDFKAKPIVMGVNDHYVIDCHLNWSNLAEGENIERM